MRMDVMFFQREKRYGIFTKHLLSKFDLKADKQKEAQPWQWRRS